MLLKLPIIVLPILETNPVFPDPCHTRGHTQRSQAHSAHLPLRCKWFVSTHHWPNAAPSPPLSSVYSCWTLSITAPPRSPCSALHFPLLFVVFSSFVTHVFCGGVVIVVVGEELSLCSLKNTVWRFFLNVRKSRPPLTKIKTVFACWYHTVIFTKYWWDSKVFIRNVYFIMSLLLRS